MPPIIEVSHLSKEYELGRSIHRENLREFLMRKLGLSRQSAPGETPRHSRGRSDIRRPRIRACA